MKRKFKLLFTMFNSYDHWVKGFAVDIKAEKEYIFEAKLFDVGSEFGINDGRVSKLHIADYTKEGSERTIVNYDRGCELFKLNLQNSKDF